MIVEGTYVFVWYQVFPEICEVNFYTYNAKNYIYV